MTSPRGAAAASFHRAAGFSVQPEDIVCQCGAQLAYLLRPALNEPPLNGLETSAAESGTATAAACVSLCHYASVCGRSGPLVSEPSRGRWGSLWETRWSQRCSFELIILTLIFSSSRWRTNKTIHEMESGGPPKEGVSVLRNTKKLVHHHHSSRYSSSNHLY